jgi:hypothetical protein
VTTALSETCLVLMQRWQTKCAEKMDTFIADQVSDVIMLFSLSPMARQSESLCGFRALSNWSKSID